MIELMFVLLSMIMPACQAEDDLGPCYWNAEIQGNGEGSSFIVLPTSQDNDQSLIILLPEE